MSAARGFSWSERKNGDVAIDRDGRVVAVLRGPIARKFLVDVERQGDQELMARLTGNYRRGNEREARSHPRNR